MKAVFQKVILGCAVLSLVSIASTASAHENPWAACKTATNPQECMHTQMAQHMQEHETKLHDALKLSAAQEPAWKAYTDVMHGQMAAMEADHQAMPSRAELEKMAAPDLLQQHLTMMQKHIVAMQSRLDATKTLYAVLTPQQQTIINAEAHKMMHHHEQRGADHGHTPAN